MAVLQLNLKCSRTIVYAPLLNPIALVELIYSAKSRCEIPKYAGPSTIIDGL